MAGRGRDRLLLRRLVRQALKVRSEGFRIYETGAPGASELAPGFEAVFEAAELFRVSLPERSCSRDLSSFPELDCVMRANRPADAAAIAPSLFDGGLLA